MRVATKGPDAAFSTARRLLWETYSRIAEQRGKKPSAKEFFPVPLEILAQEVLGWRVEKVASLGHYGDTSRLDPVHGRCDFDDRVLTIGVDNVPLEQQNFTIAHEIGHIVLHGDHHLVRARRVRPLRGVKPGIRDKTAWQLERDANLFAVELLMPEKAVREKFKENFGSERLSAPDAIRLTRPHEYVVWEITNQTLVRASELLAVHTPNGPGKSLMHFFGVSRAAMALRLRELGLVGI